MALRTVERSSLSDAVFDQLASEIVGGALAAGDELPSERTLTELLGVNRGAVREGLKRLAQAGLVHIRHGGSTRVRDFQRTGGLDLLPLLLIRPDGRVDPVVTRGLLELRAAIGADAARLAARRASPAHVTAVVAAAEALDGAATDDRQNLALAFWGALVDAAENVAYRLAFNSLERTYEPVKPLLAQALADELSDRSAYRAIAAAIAAHDEALAGSRASDLLARGTAGIGSLLDALEALT